MVNIETIPKSFWHSASFALIAFTLGFLFISYNYGDLTVKFNQLEVRTTNTDALEESLNALEEIIRKKEKEITELRSLLDSEAAELLNVQQELADFQASKTVDDAGSIVSKINAISKNNNFSKDYEVKKQALTSLSNQQQQQQQTYNTQKRIIQQQQQLQMTR